MRFSLPTLSVGRAARGLGDCVVPRAFIEGKTEIRVVQPTGLTTLGRRAPRAGVSILLQLIEVLPLL